MPRPSRQRACLQEWARILFELEARPDEKELRALSGHWSSWRERAAGLSWRLYHVAKEWKGMKQKSPPWKVSLFILKLRAALQTHHEQIQWPKVVLWALMNILKH